MYLIELGWGKDAWIKWTLCSTPGLLVPPRTPPHPPHTHTYIVDLHLWRTGFSLLGNSWKIFLSWFSQVRHKPKLPDCGTFLYDYTSKRYARNIGCQLIKGGRNKRKGIPAKPATQSSVETALAAWQPIRDIPRAIRNCLIWVQKTQMQLVGISLLVFYPFQSLLKAVCNSFEDSLHVPWSICGI